MSAFNIAVSPETPKVSYTAEMRARSIISRMDSLAAKLKTLEDDIRLLWIDFDNLKAGETILGCATKKEFCEKKLHRTPRAIQYLLAGQSNPVDRPHKQSELSSPPVAPSKASEPATQQQTPKTPETLETLASTVTPVTPTLAEPAEQFPTPSRTTLLREWFLQKWKFFKLGSCEHDLVGMGGRMGKYDLLLIGLTPRQVKLVGEALQPDNAAERKAGVV